MVTIKNIMEATNLSKGAIYHHFESKEEMPRKEITEIRKKETQIDLMIRSAEDLIQGYETWIDEFTENEHKLKQDKKKNI